MTDPADFIRAMSREDIEDYAIRLRNLLGGIMPDRLPGPFICGRSATEDRNGLPDRLMVCPAFGADIASVYLRQDAASETTP